MGRKVFYIFGLLIFGFVYTKPTLVVAAPSFPTCTNPSGAVVANYSDGVHGVPGNSNSYSGVDVVYDQGGNNALQCLCVNGSGIQTTWWNVSEMSTQEIQTNINAGWIYIPNGQAWGLSDAPYLALNSNYNCGGGNNGGNGGDGGTDGGGSVSCNAAKPPAPVLNSVVKNGSTAVLSWSSVTPVTHYSIVYGTTPGVYIYGVANVGNVTTFTVGALDPNTTYYFGVRAVNDCTPSDLSGSGGQVLGASTFGQVLGLAGTGTTLWLIALILIGISSLVTAIYLRRHAH